MVMGLDIQEGQINRYALGKFGDSRLKKQERCCMHGWLSDKKFACVNWVETVREKFVSVGSWPIRA
jgi:hypothetical protein